MTQDTFVGSDESQSAGPLRHVQTVTFAGPLALENGETLPSVTVEPAALAVAAVAVRLERGTSTRD